MEKFKETKMMLSEADDKALQTKIEKFAKLGWHVKGEQFINKDPANAGQVCQLMVREAEFENIERR